MLLWWGKDTKSRSTTTTMQEREFNHKNKTITKTICRRMRRSFRHFTFVMICLSMKFTNVAFKMQFTSHLAHFLFLILYISPERCAQAGSFYSNMPTASLEPALPSRSVDILDKRSKQLNFVNEDLSLLDYGHVRHLWGPIL